MDDSENVPRLVRKDIDEHTVTASSTMSSRTCRTCRWVNAINVGEYECRRNPPTASIVMQQVPGGVRAQAIGVFPPVQSKHWCGEWGPEVQ